MEWQFYIAEIYKILTRASLDPEISTEDAHRMQLEILYSLYLIVANLEETIGKTHAEQTHKEVREHIEQRYKHLMENLDVIFERP